MGLFLFCKYLVFALNVAEILNDFIIRARARAIDLNNNNFD